MTILVDSAIWIDLFAARQTPAVSRFKEFVRQQQRICICGLIITEVLQGVRQDSQLRKLESMFCRMPYLPMSRSTFVRAGKMFRQLRAGGISIRNTIDCLIAAIVLEHKVKLLSVDRDFYFIQAQFALDLI